MKTLLIILALLLINCGYRCVQTDSSAEALSAQQRGARVTVNKYGVFKYCERKEK